MKTLRAVSIACTAATLAGALSIGPRFIAPAFARTPYDGTWSVSIITDAGDCDRGFRYAVTIVDGRLVYNDPNFDVFGEVDPHGRVVVRIKAGESEANGTGHLSGNYGDGEWSGRSPTASCSGHWEAERRG
jgi:hypothetical protein